MFLNDLVDAGFDAQFRRERPIPAGWIDLKTVGWWSGAWLAAGTLLLASLGKPAAPLALLLLASIVVYDVVHKAVPFAPALMGLCRFFLYLVAASAGQEGIQGIAVWGGVVMGSYIVGLSYLARTESKDGPLRYWPCLLLATPMILAWFINDGEYRQNSVVLSALLALWVVRCLRWTFSTEGKNVGRTVSGLLAGIVLVDMLMVLPEPYPDGLVFLGLLGLALLFQRFVPAT
jgi:4-hydroxybenzoate polyprenyltransferase